MLRVGPAAGDPQQMQPPPPPPHDVQLAMMMRAQQDARPPGYAPASHLPPAALPYLAGMQHMPLAYHAPPPQHGGAPADMGAAGTSPSALSGAPPQSLLHPPMPVPGTIAPGSRLQGYSAQPQPQPQAPGGSPFFPNALPPPMAAWPPSYAAQAPGGWNGSAAAPTPASTPVTPSPTVPTSEARGEIGEVARVPTGLLSTCSLCGEGLRSTRSKVFSVHCPDCDDSYLSGLIRTVVRILRSGITASTHDRV